MTIFEEWKRIEVKDNVPNAPWLSLLTPHGSTIPTSSAAITDDDFIWAFRRPNTAQEACDVLVIILVVCLLQILVKDPEFGLVLKRHHAPIMVGIDLMRHEQIISTCLSQP